jgi:hypothetical protein
MTLKFRLLPALVLLLPLILTACGTVTVPLATPGGQADGNWLITGNRQTNQYPVLSAALLINGNQISATGDLAYQCPSITILSSAGFVQLTGQIASDGTFQLTTLQPPVPLSTAMITIQGKVPAKGSSSWTGSYSIDIGCTANQSGTFTATPIPPVNGTYSGSFTGTPLLAASLQITQGSPYTASSLGTQFAVNPLAATITIQGSPCFKQGTTAGSLYDSQIMGEFISLNFIMDDGSQLSVSGTLNNTSETSIDNVFFMVIKNQCSSPFGVTTLTLQPTS